MADGELTLKLDDDIVRRLRAVADATGVTMGRFAADLIADGLDHDWTEALASLAEYDRTGVSYSLDEAMNLARNDLEEKLAARK